tara:strand:- start:234 stop:710 length:477 start_codon:yes stop_codon:yes gene_type:complete
MGLEDEATQDSVSSMPPPPVPPPLPSTPKQPPKMTQMPNSQAFQNQPNVGYGNPNLSQQIIIVPSNGMATTGLIFGIISMIISLASPFFLFICCLLSVPMALLGALFSHLGYSQSRTNGVGGGAAIGGLVLNWMQILIGIVLLFLLILGIALPSSGGA